MKKILVIEDNPDIRENISELLRLEGFVISTAANGIDGVEKALNELPDLVLCDVMMPELDGFGVLRQLRTDDRTALTPLIFLTARSEKADIGYGLSKGAIAYLVKPFTDDQLINAVLSALHKGT